MKLHSSSPLVMSIKIYNKLPEALKQEERDKTFNKLLKKHLIAKSYYSTNEYLSDR